MVCHVDLEAVVTGKDAALFADTAVVGVGFALVVVGSRGCAVTDGYRAAEVLLFAAVDGAILYAFDVEVSGAKGNAAAVNLRAFEGGVAAALDDGAAVFVADVGMAVGQVIAVAVAFAVVAAGGKASVAWGKRGRLCACPMRLLIFP